MRVTTRLFAPTLLFSLALAAMAVPGGAAPPPTSPERTEPMATKKQAVDESAPERSPEDPPLAVPADVSGLSGSKGAFGAPTADGSGGLSVAAKPAAPSPDAKTKKIHLPGPHAYTYQGQLYGPSANDGDLIEVPEGFNDPAPAKAATVPEGDESFTREELKKKSVPELKALADQQELEVTRGDGEDGSPLKDDYIDALATD